MVSWSLKMRIDSQFTIFHSYAIVYQKSSLLSNFHGNRRIQPTRIPSLVLDGYFRLLSDYFIIIILSNLVSKMGIYTKQPPLKKRRLAEGSEDISAVSGAGSDCTKCGRRSHKAEDCTANMSDVKCF